MNALLSTRLTVAATLIAVVAAGSVSGAKPAAQLGVYQTKGTLSITKKAFSGSGSMTLANGSGMPKSGTYGLWGTFTDTPASSIDGCPTPGRQRGGWLEWRFANGMSHRIAVQAVCAYDGVVSGSQSRSLVIVGWTIGDQVVARFTTTGKGTISWLKPSGN